MAAETKMEVEKKEEPSLPKKLREENGKEEPKAEMKKEEPKAEMKEAKKEEKKGKSKVKLVKKDKAVVNGEGLRISTKHSMFICNAIRGKTIDDAVAYLEQVAKMKQAVPMSGEIPHRKGKGMMSGRYPVNAAMEFIRLLKLLKANAVVNQMEIEKSMISAAIANQAPRMRRRGGTRAKSSHVYLELREKKVENEKIKEAAK